MNSEKMSWHDSSDGWGQGRREGCPREKTQHAERCSKRDRGIFGDLQAAQYVWGREERGESMKVWGRVKEVGLYGSGYLYRLRMELNLERGEGARETWKSWTRRSGWMEKQRLEEADHLKLAQKRLSTHLGRPLIVPWVTSWPAVDVKL